MADNAKTGEALELRVVDAYCRIVARKVEPAE
jgi:hypothetical protein